MWGVMGGKGVMIVGGDSAESGDTSLTVSSVIARLRTTTGVGRTVLRVTAKGDGMEWLRGRNAIVGSVKVADKLQVMLCESGTCREVKSLEEL